MESQSVIHRYVDAWNQHDTAGLSAAFTATGTWLDPTISAPISRPALAPAVGRAADHSYARLHDGFSVKCWDNPRWKGQAMFAHSLARSEGFYLYSLYKEKLQWSTRLIGRCDLMDEEQMQAYLAIAVVNSDERRVRLIDE